jgi:hypothetical protein
VRKVNIMKGNDIMMRKEEDEWKCLRCGWREKTEGAKSLENNTNLHYFGNT